MRQIERERGLLQTQMRDCTCTHQSFPRVQEENISDLVLRESGRSLGLCVIVSPSICPPASLSLYVLARPSCPASFAVLSQLNVFPLLLPPGTKVPTEWAADICPLPTLTRHDEFSLRQSQRRFHFLSRQRPQPRPSKPTTLASQPPREGLIHNQAGSHFQNIHYRHFPTMAEAQQPNRPFQHPTTQQPPTLSSAPPPPTAPDTDPRTPPPQPNPPRP